MSIAQFSLVRKKPVVLVRQHQGRVFEGNWIEGEEEFVEIKANIHPFSDYQLSIMPEADRSRSWLWLFTSDIVRHKKEGVNGHGADRFEWEGEMYEVMKVQTFSMGVSDHFEAKCTRIELTPN